MSRKKKKRSQHFQTKAKKKNIEEVNMLIIEKEKIKKRKKTTTTTKKKPTHWRLGGEFKGIFGSSFSLLVFSQFWGENFLVGTGRKHMGPPFIFLSPHSTKHTLKKFLFLFFFQSFLFTLFHLQTNTPLVSSPLFEPIHHSSHFMVFVMWKDDPFSSEQGPTIKYQNCNFQFHHNACCYSINNKFTINI